MSTKKNILSNNKHLLITPAQFFQTLTSFFSIHKYNSDIYFLQPEWILRRRVIFLAGVRIPLMVYQWWCLSDCFTYFLINNAPIHFGAPNIKHPGLLAYPKQSVRTRALVYRDSPNRGQRRKQREGPVDPYLRYNRNFFCIRIKTIQRQIWDQLYCTN